MKKSGPSGVEGVRGKGMMKDDAPGMSHEVKSEPDGKGGYKKRVDSGAQKELGPGPTYQEGEGDGPKRESVRSPFYHFFTTRSTPAVIQIHKTDEE